MKNLFLSFTVTLSTNSMQMETKDTKKELTQKIYDNLISSTKNPEQHNILNFLLFLFQFYITDNNNENHNIYKKYYEELIDANNKEYKDSSEKLIPKLKDTAIINNIFQRNKSVFFNFTPNIMLINNTINFSFNDIITSLEILIKNLELFYGIDIFANVNNIGSEIGNLIFKNLQEQITTIIPIICKKENYVTNMFFGSFKKEAIEKYVKNLQTIFNEMQGLMEKVDKNKMYNNTNKLTDFIEKISSSEKDQNIQNTIIMHTTIYCLARILEVPLLITDVIFLRCSTFSNTYYLEYVKNVFELQQKIIESINKKPELLNKSSQENINMILNNKNNNKELGIDLLSKIKDLAMTNPHNKMKSNKLIHLMDLNPQMLLPIIFINQQTGLPFIIFVNGILISEIKKEIKNSHDEEKQKIWFNSITQNNSNNNIENFENEISAILLLSMAIFNLRKQEKEYLKNLISSPNNYNNSKEFFEFLISQCKPDSSLSKTLKSLEKTNNEISRNPIHHVIEMDAFVKKNKTVEFQNGKWSIPTTYQETRIRDRLLINYICNK